MKKKGALKTDPVRRSWLGGGLKLIKNKGSNRFR